MRFHVIGLPHTQTNKAYCHCAYTQKVLNFCKMMTELGHTVFHYGGEGSDVVCTEHIDIVSNAERFEWFGDNEHTDFTMNFVFDPAKVYWRESTAKAIAEIDKRIQKQDFICLITGWTHKPIADAFPNNTTVEYGIGYEGTFAKFQCFESVAWQHYVYGLQRVKNGRWYDTVVPNYYDPADFPAGDGKGDYYMFLGRLIQRKGPNIAAAVCEHLGAKLIMAGQGVTHQEPGLIKSAEVEIRGNHVEHVGSIGVERRKALLGDAKALFVLTQYHAPFEGVHVEAMMMGTPVITTDWGCFPETVIDGVTGFRVHTLGEAIWAAKECEKLDRAAIRKYALSKWSLDVVAKRYERWFYQLDALWDGVGWPQTHYVERYRT